MKKILVLIEHSDGEIRKASYEAISEGYKLASELNIDLVGIAINFDDDQTLNQLGEFGLSDIISVRAEDLEFISGEVCATILKNFIEAEEADLILLSATALGKEIAPRLSGKLDARVASDCTKIELDNDTLNITRPIYAGKILSTVNLTSDIKILTLRPNIFEATALDTSVEPEIRTERYSVDNLKAVIEAIISEKGSEISLTEADVIVTGGRGVKGPENFELLKELADLLGGAVGASRSAVDSGWIDHSHQIGQTGKVVSPKLYIACGVSGAIQHLAGMSSSKCIVAVNKDPDAPIFHVADYGIVGDLFEVVPVMIEEIKKLK